MLAARDVSSTPDLADAPAPAKSRDGWLDTLVLLGGALVLFALDVGAYPLWDPGEGRNAQAAREMAADGRWLVPLLYGEPYYDKPAPFFALLRAFQALLGESELALRLPSVVASLGTLLLLHRFALPRYGRRTAALAGVIYATSPEVVVLARFCNFDATLAFLVTAAVVAWLSWLDERRAFPWQAWTAMGLGVLIKGPVAIVLPLLIALACAYRRGVLADAARAARPLRGMLVLGAVVLPWLLPATITDPDYVRTFLVRHNVERYLSSGFEHVRNPLFFLPVIAGGMFPWSLLVPVAALSRRRALEPAIWAGVIILFFSLGQAKLATYVLPAFPGLALWIACGVTAATAVRVPRARRLLRAAVAVWAGLLVLLPVGLLVYVRTTYPELTSAVAWSAPLPLLAWLGARRIRAERLRPIAVCAVFAAVNVALLVIFYARATPFVSHVASDAAIAHAAQRLAPGATILGFKIQPASLSYYAAGGAVRRARDTDEIRAAASRGPLLIVTRRRHERTLRAAGIPLYVWLDTRRHLLYATVPVS